MLMKKGTFAKAGITEMSTGAPLPGMMVSLNAYLGAPGIVSALATGRRRGDHRPHRRQRPGTGAPGA